MRFINHIKRFYEISSQRRKLDKDGTLLNAFKKKRIIFIHIPKTAGISLIRSIYGNVDLGGHRDFCFYKSVFGDDFNKCYTFSFIRNPWDRVYSAYKFLEKGGVNIHDRNAFDMYLSRYDNFEDFIMNGLSKGLLNKINHLRPQSDFICNKNGDVLVDFLGRFETIGDDLSQLESHLEISIKLDHHNMNPKASYMQIYTEEMISKVKQVYNRDINIFGYDF